MNDTIRKQAEEIMSLRRSLAERLEERRDLIKDCQDQKAEIVRLNLLLVSSHHEEKSARPLDSDKA